MSQPARVLDVADVRALLRYVSSTRYAMRNRVMVLLSFKAGLRACEIAGLDWSMVLQPRHGVADHITVPNRIAKMRSARRLPMHPQLKAALSVLHLQQGQPIAGPVIQSDRGAHMRSQSIVNWFRAVYAELGFDGCSSHSGRRTFITRSARLLPRTGGSLRDVQELAGHRSLTTTERYIAGDRAAQCKLVQLV